MPVSASASTTSLFVAATANLCCSAPNLAFSPPSIPEEPPSPSSSSFAYPPLSPQTPPARLCHPNFRLRHPCDFRLQQSTASLNALLYVAAAALPEDHPHALRFPDRCVRPESRVMRIVRSPMALRYRLMGRFGKGKGKERQRGLWGGKWKEEGKGRGWQDGDEEEKNGGKEEGEDQGQIVEEEGDGLAEEQQTDPLEGDDGDEVESKDQDDRTQDDPHVADLAFAVAARRHAADSTDMDCEDLNTTIGKAISSPHLLHDPWRSPLAVRRSRSAFALGRGFKLPRIRPRHGSNASTDSDHRVGSWLVGGNGDESTENPLLQLAQNGDVDRHDAHDGSLRLPSQREAVIHDVPLQAMAISEQLRSLSQMSGSIMEEEILPCPHPWTFHRRDTSQTAELNTSWGRAAHIRQRSSTDFGDLALTPSLSRVRSTDGDGSSSIYSRSCSLDRRSNEQHADSHPTQIPYDLNAISDGWLLQRAGLGEFPSPRFLRLSQSIRPLVLDHEQTTHAPEVEGKHLPASQTPPFLEHETDSSSVYLAPSRCTIPSNQSSSNTLKSKRSRFSERFSPPRTIPKRRSIFRFLLPGSRRNSGAINVPVFHSSSLCTLNNVDGPSNTPDLTPTQYELTDHPQHGLSGSGPGPGPATPSPTNHLVAPVGLDRRPSLAEYERSLTVVGDDRRKPSMIDPQRLEAVHAEDRRESLFVRRKLKRATALEFEDASPLMKQALVKHQEEKAMFCSQSKRRESLGLQQAPVFRDSVFGPASAVFVPPNVREENEHLDPLAQSHEHGYGRSRSVGSLSHELNSPVDVGSRRSVSISSLPVNMSQTQGDVDSTTASKPSKIGTLLSSWSRFPSHTRSDRCGSATQPDEIITRDFADQLDVDKPTDNAQALPVSQRYSKTEGKQAKQNHRRFIRSRSMSFDTVFRFYRNLFSSSDFHGQNRRTSVNIGGKLHRPELEMLSSPTATTAEHHHARHIHEHLKEIEEHLFEDIEGLLHRPPHQHAEKKHHHHHHFHSGSPFYKDQNSEPTSSPTSTPRKEDDTPSVSPPPESNEKPELPSPPHIPIPTIQIQADDPPLNSDLSHTFDGAIPSSSPSKAELFSAEYQACVSDPLTPLHDDPLSLPGQISPLSHEEGALRRSLSPASPPSFASSLPLGRPRVRVTRYPSVTVIDDRQGQVRSVSLISNTFSPLASATTPGRGVRGSARSKSSSVGLRGWDKGKGMGFERESTRDLFLLLKAREWEEKEKLMGRKGEEKGHGGVEGSLGVTVG